MTAPATGRKTSGKSGAQSLSGALASVAGLMRARRFAPLFWCQFLSAFNDNYVRNMLAMLILFRLGEGSAGALITGAIGIFILPTLLLSGLGGEIADTYDKARFARALKAAEIAVQCVAAAGLFLSSLPLLYAALFGLGVIAALFGPLKYAILPDLVEREALVGANALVEAATFAAILLGLIAGGLSATTPPVWVFLQLMGIALAAWLASLFIPTTQPAAPGLALTRNILASTAMLFKLLRSDASLWRRSAAVSWFWMTGAVALSLTPVIARDRLGGGIAVETAITALFALGIGAGSLAAALIARGRISLKGVPVACLAMGLFLIDLGVSTLGLPAPVAELGLGAFFTSAAGLRLAFDIFGLACAGGLFVVPLFTSIQAEAPAPLRARMVGAVNVLNSAFMVAGVAATAALQFPLIGLSESALSATLGALTLGCAVYVRRCLDKPAFII